MTMRVGNRLSVLLVISLIIIGFLIFLFFYIKHEFTKKQEIITEDVMVQKITSMGKLELIKYSMRDVLEKKEVRLILPDEKVLFLAVGEVTACIDLTKVNKKDIDQTTDTVTITLPRPEICYARLDHQQSKVYDITGAFFPGNAKNMVEDVYKLAEQRLLNNAQKMNITGKAQENASLIFKPLLENISGKKVVLKFSNK